MEKFVSFEASEVPNADMALTIKKLTRGKPNIPKQMISMIDNTLKTGRDHALQHDLSLTLSTHSAKIKNALT